MVIKARKRKSRVRSHPTEGEDKFSYLRNFARWFQERQLAIDLAGIFFVAAVEHAARGHHAHRQLEARLSSFKNVFAEIGSLRRKREAKKRLEGVTEDRLVNTLKDIRRLEILYEPVVSEYSLATVAAAASAEAYINEVAEIVISGRTSREYFDKLPLQAKWLFLPQLLGYKRVFQLDRDPLQSFNALIRNRNALVHFKGSSHTLEAAAMPLFLSDLGLLPKSIEQSIAAVRELIRQFSLAWRGSNGPGWLYPSEKAFRRPCFYLGNRQASMVLWADELDKARFE